MVLFLTPWFVLFACVAFPLYWLVSHRGVRLLTLLAFCVVFHGHFAGPAGVLPIVILGVFTYLAGLSRHKAACSAGIVLCVAALVFYKYTRFLCLSLVGAVWPHGGDELLKQAGPLLPLAPPLAISFFVFEFVHYLYDVRRGEAPIKNALHFALFSLFWPSIVAGPVKRYGQFLPALQAGICGLRKRDVAVGLVLVAVGLVKKLAADGLTAYVTSDDKHFAALSMTHRWTIFVAIGLRILWDFSGYSDMAIGFALMFGIRLPVNFNWPYLALSITEFWRRWHISLSEWIRDYIYIPLGGSRHGLVRKAGNALLAFAICGLWHGAAWNFLFWGLYHGAGLAVSSSYQKLGGAAGRGLAAWFACNRIAAWAATMVFVHVGWLFFFYPVPTALRMLRLLVARA
jgi:alginate O-acetyltransferase complex protein AlgI